ncbi:metallophosphoesterase [Microbacterium phage Big4]|nr:metallophosphoesterase [Microbacterium phage Big4]
MTQRLYTTDPHINHELVSVERMLRILNKTRTALGLRPLHKDELTDDQKAQMVIDHARLLGENWDRVVGPDDTVYVLGDIAMNPKKGAFEWFRERPGKKILIAGNHDEVAGFRSKGLNARIRPEWADTFVTITDFTFLKIGGHRVALSHYPYDGEGDREFEGGDRLLEVRLRDEGVPLLHGHTHGRHKAHTSLKGTPMFHVGPDAWDMELVPESTIIEWLDYLPRKD